MTLIEVLVAMTILSIGLLAMTDVIAASQTAATKSKYDAIALQAAQNEVANDEATGYNDLTAGTTVTIAATGVTNALTGMPPGSTMTVVIGPLDGDSDNDSIMQVDVTITWGGGSGQAATGGNLAMSTLVSDSLDD